MTCLKYLVVTNHINALYLLPKNHVLELFQVEIAPDTMKKLSQILIDWNPKYAKMTKIQSFKECCKIDLRLSLFSDNEKTLLKLISGSQQKDKMDIINSYRCIHFDPDGFNFKFIDERSGNKLVLFFNHDYEISEVKKFGY